MNIRYISVSLVALAVAACGSMVKYDPEEYVRITGGSLVLNSQLTVRAHKASVEIQGGRTVDWRHVDQYHPYCSLELRKPVSQSHSIKAGKFRITRVVYDENAVSAARVIPVATVIRGGSSDVISYEVSLYLASSHAPEVERLVCAHWMYLDEARHLKISEIRAALGKIISLEITTRSVR